MRFLTRVLLVCFVVGLASGPLLALPLSAGAGATWTAPATPGSVAVRLLKCVALGAAAFGAIQIKDAGSLAKKFVQRASAAAGDYKDGVASSGAAWEANTTASEDNYKMGVTAAANDGRFGKGVRAAGAAKFTQRATTLGAQRYPTGVGASEGDWAKGTQPYLQIISGLTLPPRRPKGDPGNFARSNAVATALRAAKVGK